MIDQEDAKKKLTFDYHFLDWKCQVCGELLSDCCGEKDDSPYECNVCHMRVHQSCYYIEKKTPHNMFQCDLCKSHITKTPKCVFCPYSCLRAMKSTSDKKNWAHVVCIQYMPGAYITEDYKYFDGLDSVNPELYKIYCMFCRKSKQPRDGAVIQCSHGMCPKSFHVLCGRLNKCYLGWNNEKDCLEHLCPTHSPEDVTSARCVICGKDNDETSMILCDECGKGYHIYCLEPPLLEVPEEDWYCEECMNKTTSQQNKTRFSLMDDKFDPLSLMPKPDALSHGNEEDEDELLQEPIYTQKNKKQSTTKKKVKLELRCGFNLLFFGFGSKISLMYNYINTILRTESVIVIKGYNPNFSIEDLLSQIYSLYPSIEKKYKNTERQIHYIYEYISTHIVNELYICITSFDGPAFRENRMQQYISQLVKCPKVHLFVTVDTIKYNIYIPPNILDIYNFIYHNVTTFEPYIEEKAFMNINLHSKQLKTNKGLEYILKSVTENHLKILKLIASECETHKEGIAFAPLLNKCISRMYTNNDMSLRLIMKEMIDHDLVKEKLNKEEHTTFYSTSVTVSNINKYQNNK
ncbi:hypothetical protein WA158_006738 [Blastocystis sp. Blastoise]